MEFRLLGSLEVWRNGENIVLGGQRQRTVLAALLMRSNELASVSYLAQAVWEKPPVAPESNVRTYIAGLRRVLSENRLVTRPGGYLVAVEPGELDVDDFRRLADSGGRAWQDGDFESAAEQFKQALGLWRGQPLAGLLPGPVLRAEIVRLEDQRLTIAERYAHALIELGQPDTAIGDLRALIAEYPLREELWAQLMRALHRAGRQAEALDAFAEARQHLITELGLEPGARLRRVQQEILSGEQEPDVEVSAWRQLPMDIAEFTGRQAELRDLHAVAEPSSRTALTVAVIHGMPGVGKTRLAVHLAHQLVDAGRFDEIQLWADLRGFDAERPPIPPGAVLEHFLRLLGVSGPQIPQELESRAALFRSRLADKRALILLDNAGSEEQIRPLLPGTQGSLVLITSRRNLAGLVGARGVPLDVLPQTDAITLLSLIAGDDRVEAEPQAAARTTALCGHLPIALSLAARRLRKRPMWTVSDLAARLERAERRLDQLAPGTREMHALFTMSYQGLPPEQQRMFRLLGLHPGDDFTAESAAALAGIPPDDADFQLEAMLDEHLVQQNTPRRYRFHDLVRPYARDLAQAEEQPAHQLYTWYLYAAESARMVFDPLRTRVFELPAQPADTVVPQFADHDEALVWYESERATLRAVVQLAATNGLPQVAWQLAWVLLSFYYRRSHWDDWIETFQIALEAAQTSGDRHGEGITWRGLGVAYSDLRQFTTAIDSHQRAQAILEEVDDRHGQAWNLNNLGVVYVYLDRLTTAADCFHRALLLFRETGDRQGEGICLNNLGDTYRRLDRPDNAIGHLEQALSIQQDTGDETGLQFTLGTLGDIHHDAGRHLQAARLYEQALAVSKALGDQRTTARMLANLAQTLDADGDRDLARIRWHEAMTIFDELGDAQADTIRARLG